MTELSPDLVERALWAWIENATEGVTRENVNPRVLDLNRHRAAAALSAVLPDIIQQAKADALEAARGPYRCCPHCADDIIHDVEKDDHTVPCQICQNDIVRRAKADALREAAKKYQWGGWAERNPAVHADLASRRRQAEHAVAWLIARADQIEEAAS